MLVHECTFPQHSREQARRCGHSNPDMVADFVRATRPRMTLLTHFSNSTCSGYNEASMDALASSDTFVFGERERDGDAATLPSFKFPVAPDSSGMATIVRRVQEVSGMEGVHAARDFMTIPVPESTDHA
jgi:hypothetical protein